MVKHIRKIWHLTKPPLSKTADIMNYLIHLATLPHIRTTRQPPLAGAASLAIYTRQVPFVPCEY